MAIKPPNSRSLEEEDPPVSRPEVEDVGPLAVVGGLGGQAVVDADGVLQLFLSQGLAGLVLLLKGRGGGLMRDWLLSPSLGMWGSPFSWRGGGGMGT